MGLAPVTTDSAAKQRQREGQGLLSRLLWVPPSLDRETAEDGRFFAAVTLATLPLLLLVAVVAVPLWLNPQHPTETVTFRDSVLMVIATAIAYFVNRSGRCRAAALGFCLASVATLTDSAADAPQVLVFLPLTMLAAVALLPVRLSLVIGGAAVLAAVPVWLLAEDRSGIELPFLLNLFFFPLLLIMRGHHDRLARLRAEEMARLRAQLEHSQRLDALGKLAGSVAHDFNNLLTVIGGGAQLAQTSLPPGHRARDELALVLDAAQRAVGVTHQLLAFSRRQVMRPEPIDLNATVQGSLGLLQRLLGSNVAIRTELDPAAQLVRVDAVQCQQMLLNLAINAGDAMPQGGTLTLATRSVTGESAHADPPIASGDYTLLRVSDTGIGMDAQTLARAFEPFFTTKDQGRGTGLGLATVYGIVEQSQGAIRVRSTPGAGTTFDVFLPVTHAAQPAAAPAQPKPPRTGAPVRVLVVDDDEMVRNVAARLLTQGGYEILQASSGYQALALTDRDSPAIDLLLTDVLMPGMSGVELAQKLRERLPGLPVVFMTGYATEMLAKQGLHPDAGSFIAKPFGTEALRKAIREALEARPQGAEAFAPEIKA